MSPKATGVQHGGAIAGHIGGSSEVGFGIGATMRARAWSGGWAIPEVGPHAFLFFDDDQHLGLYTRLSFTGGLGGVRGELGPMFTAELTPGVIFYPTEDPLGLSFSLVASASGAPVNEELWAWFGFRFGLVIGGMQE